MRYLLYKFIKFIPGTSTIAALEAKRLSEYFTQNFDEHQQLVLLEEIKHNLIIHREKQIEDQKINIENQNKYLNRLETNHLKLIA